MKCICKETVYSRNGKLRTNLIGEFKDGKRRRLMETNKEGYKTILTVTPKGFELVAARSGEVLRRGKETDVFNIYDSLLIKEEACPMLVKDDIKGAALAFEDYENKYGFDRVQREVLAKFSVYTEEDCKGTAFGIVKQHWGETLEIHSIYEPELMSNKEKAEYIAEYISDKLNANEIGNISAVGIDKYSDHSFVRIYAHAFAAKFEQAKELYDDAMKRKTTISEVIKEREEAKNGGI